MFKASFVEQIGHYTITDKSCIIRTRKMIRNTYRFLNADMVYSIFAFLNEEVNFNNPHILG
jgi:hypothetical protein